MYKREIENIIKEVNETFRVLVLTGPRQVGKSTILDSLMPKNMKKISLDDKVLRKEAQENPKMFLETYQPPLYIDEVQYAPELFPYIKMIVDQNHDRGQYWLSGSQRFELMQNVSESLAGRAGIIEMNSFTYSEIIQNKSRKLWDINNLKQKEYIDVNKAFEIIFNGGMPELYDVKGINRQRFYSSYVKTYIEKDVRQILNIGSEENFMKFMRNVAIRVGTTLNYSDIANDVGVSSKTIKEWMSILIATGIVYLLEPFHSKALERLTHMPKIVFMDMGLACYLAGWKSARDLQISDVSGRYFESYVISEIVKNYNNFGEQLIISHLRNKETEEIDLIIEENNLLHPIEIKKTSNPTRDMIKNFKMLEKTEKKVGIGGIICLYDKLLPFNENQYIIPLSSLIS